MIYILKMQQTGKADLYKVVEYTKPLDNPVDAFLNGNYDKSALSIISNCYREAEAIEMAKRAVHNTAVKHGATCEQALEIANQTITTESVLTLKR